MPTIGEIAAQENAHIGTAAYWRELAHEQRKLVVQTWKIEPDASWRPWWVENSQTKRNNLANAYEAAAEAVECSMRAGKMA